MVAGLFATRSLDSLVSSERLRLIRPVGAPRLLEANKVTADGLWMSGGTWEREGLKCVAALNVNIVENRSDFSLSECKMSAPSIKKAKIGGGQPAAPEPFYTYGGGTLPMEFKQELTRVRVGPQVTEIPDNAFRDCEKLIELQLNEGLEAIGERAFQGCKSLRSVTVPPTVTELGGHAFAYCRNLGDLQLNEGLEVIGKHAFQTSLRSVTIPSTVTVFGKWAFADSHGLIEVHLKEGLQIIGEHAFHNCDAIRSVIVPSTVTKLGVYAFFSCHDLEEVHLNEGIQVIGDYAFAYCHALQSVTIPSTVNEVGEGLFADCSNLSEVIFLGCEQLLNQEFVDCGFGREEQGLLNEEAIDDMFIYEYDDYEMFTFQNCPLNTVKISISWAVSERMSRLPRECRLSVEERIHNLRCIEHQQNGNVLACFPISRMTRGGESEDGSEDEANDAAYEVRDTNHETARSLYQVLQLIAFHELKESSILIELAVWKSRIDGDQARVGCRVAIPDPAKSLIMEYCGFAGFLTPAIEGA